MNIDEAMRIVIRPHITEKTFAMVENERKICFIVEKTASKPKISEAIKKLYNENTVAINTARTISGKKAFVQFETINKTRDLATKIGMI